MIMSVSISDLDNFKVVIDIVIDNIDAGIDMIMSVSISDLDNFKAVLDIVIDNVDAGVDVLINIGVNIDTLPAWSVNTRRAAPSRHCRDVRVCGHTTAAMHDMSSPPTPQIFPSVCF